MVPFAFQTAVEFSLACNDGSLVSEVFFDNKCNFFELYGIPEIPKCLKGIKTYNNVQILDNM